MGLKRVFGSSSSEKGADVSLSATTCLCSFWLEEYAEAAELVEKYGGRMTMRLSEV